jgi:hypothetical protein
MSWSKITPSRLDSSIPNFEFQIRRFLNSRADCVLEYQKMWELFIADSLPIANFKKWDAIGASFRLEDGNGGIFFETQDGQFIDAMPVVRISNEFMEEEVSQWTTLEFMGEKSDDEIGLAWEEAKRDYAQMITSSARESGLGSVVDIAHQPLTFRVYCYDELVTEQCI